MAKGKAHWRKAVTDAAGLLSDSQSILHPECIKSLRSAADGFLEISSLSKFGRSGITHKTDEGDYFLRQQVDHLPWFEREAALISCLHAFSSPGARHQVLKFMPETDPPNARFDAILPAYLECIIHGREVNMEAFDKQEAKAAAALNKVMKLARGQSDNLFAAMWELLFQLGRPDPTACPGRGFGPSADVVVRPTLIPDQLVWQILSTDKANMLQKALGQCSADKRWQDAYRIVYGLRNIYQLPRAQRFLAQLLPDYLMWSFWRPNERRIEHWANSKNEALHDGALRGKLAQFFLLEGPDISNKGPVQATLRVSTPTHYFKDMLQPGEAGDGERRKMLSSLLEALDVAIETGPFSVRLLFDLCQGRAVDHKVVERIQDALRLKSDDHSDMLRRYLQLVRSGAESETVKDCVVTIANVLPIISSSPPLRRRWGMDLDIGNIAPRLLRRAQRILRDNYLPQARPCDAFALAVRELAQALADATWLHVLPDWTSAFVDSLRSMPAYFDIHSALQYMYMSPTPEQRQVHMEWIIQNLCTENSPSLSASAPEPRPALRPLGHVPSHASLRVSAGPFITPSYAGQPSLTPRLSQIPFPAPRPASALSNGSFDYSQDPIWFLSPLTGPQEDFKSRILCVPDLPKELAARCMRQAIQECHEQHVKFISDCLCHVTHNSCICFSTHLADLLRANLVVDQAWPDLLLHLMEMCHKESAKGLLMEVTDNPATKLEDFNRWMDSLRQVFKNPDLEKLQPLGFTAMAIQSCTQRLQSRRNSSLSSAAGFGPPHPSPQHHHPRVDSPTSPVGSDRDEVFSRHDSQSTPGTSIESRDEWIRTPSFAEVRSTTHEEEEDYIGGFHAQRRDTPTQDNNGWRSYPRAVSPPISSGTSPGFERRRSRRYQDDMAGPSFSQRMDSAASEWEPADSPRESFSRTANRNSARPPSVTVTTAATDEPRGWEPPLPV